MQKYFFLLQFHSVRNTEVEFNQYNFRVFKIPHILMFMNNINLINTFNLIKSLCLLNILA